MKADAKLTQIVENAKAENQRADQAYRRAQLRLIEVARQTIIKRVAALGVHVDVPTAPSPRSVRSAHAFLLTLRGRFLMALRVSSLNLDANSLHELTMSQTLLVKSFALDFRSLPQRASISPTHAMTSKEFQDNAGRRIAEFRAQKKFSQERLAQAIGTTSATIARIENGKQQIALTKLYAIAEVFGISPYEIMVGPRPAPAPLSVTEIDAMRRKLDKAEAELKAKSSKKVGS